MMKDDERKPMTELDERKVVRLAVLLHGEFCEETGRNPKCDGFKDYMVQARRLLPKIERMLAYRAL